MEQCFKTFVSIGNSKHLFKRLLDAVNLQIPILPRPILVQCGHTPFFSSECHVVDFVEMDFFSRHIAQSEITILHAGAGSILHAVRAGQYPIVMPRRFEFDEHINDHQLDFAHALHSLGKISLVHNESELSCAIKRILNDRSRCKSNNNTLGLSKIQQVLSDILK